MWEEPAATPAATSTSVYVAPAPTTTTTKVPTTIVTSTTQAAAAATTEAASIIDSVVTITETLLSKMLSLGVCQEGVNAVASNGATWIGKDGPYTMELINNSGEDLIIVAWGPSGSWVNVKQPEITISLASGSSNTISFADGFSGALSAIYSDTSLVNGQVSNTWIELTTTASGVVDISREVKMSGHTMSVVGPDCTTNMSTCVFVCEDDVDVCTTGYSLLNCAAGSQSGAQSGYDVYGNGGASGGCGWNGASSASFTATFS